MTISLTRAPVLAGLGRALIVALFLAVPTTAAFAQAVADPDGIATVSRPVVQSTAPSPSRELNVALARLAADPRNVSALYDAAEAALRLGDSDAAIGFLTRANELAPDNPKTKVLMGKSHLVAENPVDAVRAFDDAERAGADTFAMAPDRALAYDLVGDNGRAQRWYPVALSKGPNDETTRRYALSLAISGDRRGAEALIAPLINQQDRPTWRTRTFVMAVTGGPDEAVAVAYASMPQELAAGIAPYLRYMPRLTKAQQAAAANFGRFPRAADIGRDDPRVVQYAATDPRGPRMAEAGLIPTGAALGTAAGAERPSRAKRRRPGREEPALASAASIKPPAIVAQAAVKPAPVLVVVPPKTAVAAMPQGKTAVLSVLDLPPGAPRPAVPAIRPPQTSVAVAAPQTTGPTAGPTQPPVIAPAKQPALQAQILPQPQPDKMALAPAGTAAASVVKEAAVPMTASATTDVKPGFDLALVAGTMSAASPKSDVQTEPQPLLAAGAAPLPATQNVTAPTQPADFASLFKTFMPPAEEREAAIGAVDITKIVPKPVAKPPIADPRGERPDGPSDVSRTSVKEPQKVAPKDAKAASKDPKKALKDAKDVKTKKAAPSHPSRIWVQVLTGANKDVMGKEWRRLVKEAPTAFRSRNPYLAPWRSNYRLLTGPFESEASAQVFITKLSNDGVASYQWTSPAGQAVDTLSLK